METEMNRVLFYALCFCFAAASTMGCGAAPVQDDSLKVTKVVLYQNGIGYFERQGEFEGDELKLRIRPDQINDILTTLTVIDRSPGGQAGSVSLPVEKSSSMVLGELPEQVRDAGGLLGVLDAFRGAEVAIRAQEGGASGRIVGVEETDTPKGSKWRVTVLTDDAELVPIDVDKITKIELDDRTLTVGLEKALDVALGDGEWKPTEVSVHFPKKTAHDLIMSYVVAMPTWKPAYRLIVDDKEGKTRLQGWAVVDNVSGEDWNNVELSLTAGAPISFQVDLHTPRLPYRPDLTARTYSGTSVAPPPAVAAYRESSVTETAKPMAKKSRKRDKAEGRAMAGSSYDDRGYDGDWAMEAEEEPNYWAEPAPEPMNSSMMMDALQPSASGEQVGALFRYDVGVPVTVPDGSSALVSIINEDVDAEDILYFDAYANASTPYRAVRMHNDTAFVVERGPLTIYRSSTFVGEGISEQVSPGQTVFIPYSLEPTVHIERYQDWGQNEQQLVKVKDGVMTVESYQLSTLEFTLTNNGNDKHKVYLKVDKLSGYDLRDQEDAIAQGAVYYIQAESTPGEPVKKKVVQATKSRTTVRLSDWNAMDVLTLYVANPDADPAVKAQLQDILDLRNQIGDINHRQETLNKRQYELRDRGHDLRSNISLLGKSKGNAKLKAELTDKLMKVEDELAEIDGELVQLGEQRYGLEVQMREAFNEISLEEKAESKSDN